MDYSKVFETMVYETKKYLENNNLWAMILGISGGIDSTVTAAICHEVEKLNPELKFYGVSLPCTSNSINENDSAQKCMKAFCKPDQYWTENLQKEFMLMKATCSQRHLPTTIGQGNIKARLRMIYLYDLANYMKGLVMDTDNLTEHYLGFFTIHGDVCDYNPIGGLWKHEIYELANYIYAYYKNKLDNWTKFEDETRQSLQDIVQALDAAIGITPTDGNGVNNLGDMGQIAPAFAHDRNVDAYKKVDFIINGYLNSIGQLKDKQLYEGEIVKGLQDLYGKETVDGIISRIKRTEYKRTGLPVVISRDKYDEPINTKSN